jgi:Tol biopolymer transport system component
MKTLASILFLCLAISITLAGQNTPKEMLNNAIYLEQVNGDLAKAMEIYKKLVDDYPDDRAVVAEALYRMGLTNEKMGTRNAKNYYEKVVSGYTDQPEMVKLARARLSRILDAEKSFSGSWLERTKKEGEGIYAVNYYEKSPGQTEDKSLEGSSISPDGTKTAGIDYSIGQNVAIFDLDTREIQLITKYNWTDDNGAITYYPVWSPDSKEIAFSYIDLSGCKIKISTLDGKTRDVLKNNLEFQIVPRQWSVDGSSILAFKQDSSGYFIIGMVAATGGDFKELYKTQWKASSQLGLMAQGGASLSPDGRYIVFSDGPADNMDLYIMDTKGGTPVLLSGYPNSEYNPLWSPDGKYIVFIRDTNGDALMCATKIENGKAVGQPSLLKEGMQNIGLKDWTPHGINYDIGLNIHDIYTVSLDPETGVPNGIPEPLQYSPTGSNIQPIWSSDGKYLAFVTYGQQNQLVLLPSDGGKPAYYPIDAPGFWELSLYDLNWLPDDSGLSFSILNPEGIPVLYQVDLATGEWQHWNLPSGNWKRTACGPDKYSVVYGQADDQGAGIYIFNTETQQSVKIHDVDLNEAYYVFRQFRFSRDMKKLACDVDCPDGRKILIMDMDSGELKVLAEKYNFQAFSPDGKKVLASGENGLTWLSLDGEILMNSESSHYFSEGTGITSFDWSPDGKQLAIGTRTLIYQQGLMRNVLNQ